MAEPDAKRPRAEVEEDLKADASDASDPSLLALSKLQEVQTNLDKVNDEASDKVLEVEQKYNKIRRPIYEERSKVIQQIPSFWLTALLNHTTIQEMATEDDVQVLSFCSEVDVEDFEDIKSGFRITFKFKENPYFSNTSLTRSFCYSEDGSLSIRGDVPQWNEDYAPDHATDPGSKRSHAHDYAFMNWFMEEDVLESGMHDEVADIIKEEIWPNPMKFYEGTDMMGAEDEFEIGEEVGEMEEEMVGDEGEEYEGEEEDGEGEEGDLEGVEDVGEGEGEEGTGEEQAEE